MNARTALQLARLATSFKRKGAKVRAAIPPALEAAANDLASDMKARVPHRSGALADSIIVTPGGETTPPDEHGASHKLPKGRVAVTAGNEAITYAKATEFGTSREHAEPFFVPSIRAKRAEMKENVARAVRESVGGKS